MIYDVQLAVEDYFKTNWDGDIHYSNTEKKPNTHEWIYLDVESIYTQGGISGCAEELSLIYITAYALNKVDSAKLADRLVSFLHGVKLVGTTVGTWRPVTQGEVFDGLHFRKISFPISVTNKEIHNVS